MSPQDLLDDQLDARLAQEVQGSCVALELAVATGRLDDSARQALLGRGVPFACWPTQAWSAADTALLHQALAACAHGASLRRLFELRKEHGFATHPATRLALLWDDPAHNPYATALEG